MADNKQAPAEATPKGTDTLSKDDAAKLATLRKRRLAAAVQDKAPDQRPDKGREDAAKPAEKSGMVPKETSDDTSGQPPAASSNATGSDSRKPAMMPSALRAARAAQETEQGHTGNG